MVEQQQQGVEQESFPWKESKKDQVSQWLHLGSLQLAGDLGCVGLALSFWTQRLGLLTSRRLGGSCS